MLQELRLVYFTSLKGNACKVRLYFAEISECHFHFAKNCLRIWQKQRFRTMTKNPALILILFNPIGYIHVCLCERDQHYKFLLLSREEIRGGLLSVYVHAIAGTQITHQNGTIRTKLMRKQDKFSRSSHLATMQNDILIGSMLFCHDFPRLRLWRLPGKIERLFAYV